MRIEQGQLAECVKAGIITADQAACVWAFLVAQGERVDAEPPQGAQFTFTNVLYYLGGMLAIGALSLFMTLGFERFGGSGILFIALAYMAAAWALAERFESRRLDVPTAIMAALIVVLVPLAVLGLQHAAGMWPPGGHAEHYRDYHYFIDWRWAPRGGQSALKKRSARRARYQRNRRGPSSAPTSVGTSMPSTYHVPMNGEASSGQ